MTAIGGRTLSSHVPRRQALRSPMKVPSTKARIVVTPTRPRVQGSAFITMVFTGVPKLVVIEMPKLRVTTLFQYSPYCTIRLWCCPPPRRVVRARNAWGVICGY